MPSPPTQDFLTAHASILAFLLVVVGFVAVNLVVWWLIRPSRHSEEKLTTYECGENPQGSAWIQFNIRFYVFALIFVIFDVETVFLLPWAVVYKDIGPLAGLAKVHALYLTANPIEDFKPLASLKNMERLYLMETGISDLSPLAEMTELNLLVLHKAKVTDLGVLVAMAKKDFEGQKRFAPFWRLYLGENPLSDAAKGAQIEELKKYGARVFLAYP